MTALSKYTRLECTGLWRDAPGSHRREVVVSFGQASLILSDGRTETALSHWSLPATRRLNPGEMPALFAPAADAAETLEIGDPAMIDAIETIRRSLRARRPHPGRLRWGIVAGSIAALVLGGVLWLPGALVGHAASVVPISKRVEIGRAALRDLSRVAGTPCSTTRGTLALTRLRDRLFGPDGGTIVVLPEAVPGALHLPGRMILLDRRMLERHDNPEVAAGHALVERLIAETADPLVPLLRAAGTRATLHLLTTGDLPAAALQGYAERLLAQRADIPAAELSHGERRQLEIAIALALGSKAFLLDEPMAGMGPEGSRALTAFLGRLRAEAPILLVEHDMDAVFALADRVSVLVYGRVIASGTVDEIRADRQVRRAYLGDEA